MPCESPQSTETGGGRAPDLDHDLDTSWGQRSGTRGTWEAVNLAGQQRADVVFVLAVTELGLGAPLGPQLAGSPASLAAAAGLSAATVDGSDAAAVSVAVRQAREAGGPCLIEASV